MLGRTVLWRIVYVLLGAAAVGFPQTASAQTSTWTATSGNWSTESNWDAFPTPGDTTALEFIFASPVPAVTLTQDLADPYVLNSLTVISNTNSGVTFTGGALRFEGANARLSSAVTGTTPVVVGNQILLGTTGVLISSATAGTTSANASILAITGPITNATAGAATLTLGGSATAATNRLAGAVTDGAFGGTLSIFKTGSGVWTLSSSLNTFSGDITIEQGTLRYDRIAALGSGTGALTLGNAGNFTATLGYHGTTSLSFTRGIQLGGTGTLVLSAESTGPLTLTNLIQFTDAEEKHLWLSAASTSSTAIHDVQSLLTNNGAAALAITKTGAGTWKLSNTANSFTGGMTISSGMLRYTDPAALNWANNNIVFNANAGIVAVLETSGSITNSLGTGVNQLHFATAISNSNSGGFSAFGGPLDVTLNNDAVTPILWTDAGDPTRLSRTTELQFNSANSTDVVTFHNALTVITGTHSIRVTDNLLSDADYAVMSGAIDGVGGINKVGSGLLVLSGLNTYAGGTSINSGMLRVADPATNLNLNSTGGNLRFTGTTNGTAGTLETAGSLTNSIGTGPGQIAWQVNGSGGFSAAGGTLNVALNNDPSTALIWGTGGFVSTTHNLVLSSTSADDVVTFQNPIDLAGATRVVRVLANSFSTNDYAVMNGVLSNGGLSKQGTGLLVLTGANTFSGGIVLGSSLGGGVLRGDPATNLNMLGPEGNNVSFNGSATLGSILEISGSLTNAVGTGSGQIQWGPLGTISSTIGGSGGFSAFGGTLDVTLNNDAVTPLVWNGGTGFVANNGELQFGSVYSDNIVTFHNAIDLSNAVRSVRVTDNPNSSVDRAVMTGALTSPNPALGGLIKQGNGTLVLTADSTFSNTTTVAGGTLQLGDGGATGSVGGNFSVAAGAQLVFNHSAVVEVANPIVSTGSVLIDGPTTGGVLFTTAKSYTGTTTVQNGTLRYGVNNGLSTAGRVALNATGTLDLNGFVGTVAQLNDGDFGGGVITNGGAAAATLTISSTTLASAFSGTIQDGLGTLGIAKAGANQTLKLSGVNTYSGGTTLVSGNLFITHASAIGTGTLRLTGGVFDFGLESRDLNVPVVFAGTSTITGEGNLAFSGLGSGVAATSIVTLNATGTTLINGLTLGGSATFNGSSALTVTGVSTVSAAVTLTNGTGALMTFNDLVLSANLTLSGDSPLLIAGELSAAGANRTFTLNNTSGATIQDIGITAPGDTAARVITLTTTTNGQWTVAGTISDGAQAGGGLIVGGAGATVINGANTFSGGSSLVSGTLILGNDAALGVGTFRFASGTLDLGTANRTINTPITFGGTGLTLTGDGTVMFNNPGNAVAATSIVTVNNTGTVSINGLSIGAAITFNGPGAVNILGSSNVTAATTFTNDSGIALDVNDLVLSSNLTLSGTGSFHLSGTVSALGANRTLTVNALGGAILNNVAVTAAGDDTPRVLTFGTAAASTITVNGTISDGAQPASGIVIGASGNVLFNGSNTYTGGTSLVAGTLTAGHDQALGTGIITAVSGTLSSGPLTRILANDVVLLGTLTTTGDGLLTFNGDVTNSGGNRAVSANNTAGTIFNGTVSLAEPTFAPGTGRILTVSGAGPVVFNGVIENGGAATSGTLSISNTGGVQFMADNTFSGRVTIGAGARLTVGDGGTTGNLPQFVSVNTGMLIFNRSDVLTYSGVISGGGPVAIAGPASGGVKFDVAQTYTGQTTIAQGTLTYGVTNTLPVASRVAINSTGTLDLNGFNGGITTLSNGDAGGGVILNSGLSNALLSLTGGEFSGVIRDGATSLLAVTKLSSAGTLVLGGPNTYSGGTTLAGGTLVVNADGALGTGALRLVSGTFDSGSTDRIFAVPLTLAGTATLTGAGNVTFTGGVNSVAATSIITAANAGTTLIDGLQLGGALTFAGSSAVTVTGASEVTAAVTLTNNADHVLTFHDLVLSSNLAFSGTNSLALSGVLSANGANRTLTLGTAAGMVVNDIAVTAAADVAARLITLTTTTNGTLTVNGVISDGAQAGGGLIFGGAGSIVLNGQNTFSGLSTLVSGTLAIGAGDALGTGTLYVAGGVVSNAAAPHVLNNNFNLVGTLTVTGDQQLTVDGAITNNLGNRTISANNSAGLVLNGNINLAEDAFGAAVGRVLTLSGSGPIKVNGLIANGGLATSGTISISNTGGVIFAADNTFTGRVSIQAGARLTVGDGGTTGTLPGLVTTTGTLVFNRSDVYVYGGVIAGVGNLVVEGPVSGGVRLNAANTYTGLTTIEQGTLRYGVANALATTARVAVNSGGTLDFNGFAATIATLSDGLGGGGQVTNSGAAMTLVVSQGDFSGTIDGANLGLFKLGITNTDTGAGVLRLSGANSFSGASTLSQGTIVVGHDLALGTANWNITGTLGIIQGDGLARTLMNNFSMTGNGTIGGSSDLTFNGTFMNNSGNRTLTINNTGVTTFNGDLLLSEAAAARQLQLFLGDGSQTVIAGSVVNGANTGTLTINGAGGNLLFTSASDFRSLIVTGTGNDVSLAASGALQTTNATPVITIAGLDNTLTLSGSVGASAFAVTGTNGAVHVYSHVGSGAISLTGGGSSFTVYNGAQVGNGAIVLNNDTTFEIKEGATVGDGTISTLGSATFILDGTKGLGNATLDGGAILRGSGVSSGTWTMAVGSTIEVGGIGNADTLTLGGLVINGGTIHWDLGTISDLLISNARPIINSTATINIADSGGFGVGDYTLISGYGGLVIANTQRFNILAPAGYKKSLESLAGQLILHISAATTRTWSAGVSNVWNDGVTANFTGETYSELDRDAVAFLDGAANGDITISNGGLGLSPSSILIDNTATTYTFRGDSLTGDGQLIKRGGGLAVIANNNTFTGGVLIAGGTLQLGEGGATGQVETTSPIALDNGATLAVNRSDTLLHSGGITGSGGVRMIGSGTLQLSGFNTYLGGTTVASGAVEITGAGVGNEFGGWTIDGGVMNVLSSTNQVTETINVNGGALNVNLSNAARVVTGTVVNIGAGGTLNVESGTLTAPTLNVLGGTLNLNGPNLTAPAVLFNVASGTVNLNASNVTLGLSQFGGGLGETALVNIASGLTLTLANTLTFTATANPASDPNGAVITGDGTLHINAARTLAINDSANAEYDFTIDVPIGLGGFVKSGAGTLYLKGANASTSVNTLSAGTIAIGNDAAFGTGNLNVTAGNLRSDGTPRSVSNFIDVRGSWGIEGASDIALASVNNAASLVLTVNNSGNTTITSLVLSPSNTASTQTIRGTGDIQFISILAGTGTGGDSINFEGQGNYHLLGANTYTGVTSIRDGTVIVHNPAALGLSSSVILGVASAVTRSPTLLLADGITLTNDLLASNTGTGNNVLTFGGATAGAATFAGNITFSQGITLRAPTGGQVDFNGVLDDFGAITAGVTITGGGTVVLNGANVYTGPTIVSQGTLRAGSAAALGSGASLQVDLGAAFDLNGFDIGVMTLTDGATGGGTIINGGVARTLTVGGGSFSGTIAGGANVSLVKNTTGVLTLGGTNSYTGTTLVADGSLLVDGSFAGAAVNVASAGILGGDGAIAGVVTSSGAVAPGGSLSLGQLVLNGGSLHFNLDSPAASDTILLTGGVAPIVNDAVVLNITAGANFDEGTYALITGYNGNTIDPGQFLNLSSPTTLNGLRLMLQNNDGSLDLVAVANQLIWTGAAGTNWNAVDANWTGDLSVFAAGSHVRFDNSTLISDVAVDAAGVAPRRVVVDNDAAHPYVFAGGAVAGDRLIKEGIGSLVLKNAHTYAHGVTVNGGELVIGDGITSGSLAGDVVNNALMSFARSDSYTFAGNISGTGALRQIGSGTLILSGDNSFTGPTTIEAGHLEVGGNFASTIYNNTLVQSTVVANSTDTATFAAPIVGNVEFLQTGAGVTILEGANTYTGGTIINTGTLVIGDSLIGTSDVDVNAGGTFVLDAGAALATPGPIVVSGTADVDDLGNTPGMFVADGNVTADAVLVQQGGLLKGSGSITGEIVVAPGGGLSPGNSVESLSMDGLSLSSESSLFFEFRDAAGTTPGTDWDLIDLGAGILTIDADNINPDNRIKIYISSWKLNNSGPGGGTADDENYNHFNAAPGTVDGVQEYDWLFLSAGSINLVNTQPGSMEGRFEIIDDVAGAGVFGTGNPFQRPSSSWGQGTFSVRQVGSNLYIHYSAIPEPGSLTLCGLGALAAGWYRRRRQLRREPHRG